MTGILAADQLQRVSACISVRDLDTALAWYRDVLGFTPLRGASFPALGARLAFVAHGEHRIELVQTDGSTGAAPPEPPGHTTVRGLTQLSLYVNRLDLVLSRLQDQGIQLAMPASTVEAIGIRACFLRDPDGNLIELIELLDDQEGSP